MNTMDIQVQATFFLNGEPQAWLENTTLAHLAEVQALQKKRYAIEVNGSVIPKSQHGASMVQQGDRIEIVIAVGGG
jgi:sulfur carrier protein